jgi:hypothetical protein
MVGLDRETGHGQGGTRGQGGENEGEKRGDLGAVRLRRAALEAHHLRLLVLAAPAASFDGALDSLTFGWWLEGVAGVASFSRLGMALVVDRFLGALGCGRRGQSSDASASQRDRTGRKTQDTTPRRRPARGSSDALHDRDRPVARSQWNAINGPFRSRNSPSGGRFRELVD